MGSQPQTGTTGPSEHAAEQLIGRLLQLGVILSATLVLIGGIKLEAERGSTHPNYAVFSGTDAALRSVGSIVATARQGDGRAVIQLGLLVLIATPIARVAFMLVMFALQRDRLYVVLTTIVLLLLLYGLLSGA